MKIIAKQAQGEIVEKKSRFIATICPVTSKKEAEAFVSACKKKYWDARHNCSACLIGSSNEFMHSSDDGEPSGTAGRPMLDVLLKQEIHNVCVVVTRYFGGVLLGTGGLVRAYQGAVLEALVNSDIREQIDVQELTIQVEYAEIGKVQYYIEQQEFVHLEDTQYAEKVRFFIHVPVAQTQETCEAFVQLMQGKVQIEKGQIRPNI